jgi:prepilin-type N-terminal cleavage/methylation domain-containing protein
MTHTTSHQRLYIPRTAQVFAVKPELTMKTTPLRPFSLVEMLVAIAIIGILSSLLTPSLGKMLDRGKELQCANNLKALNTAIMFYIDDNTRFPHTYAYDDHRGNQRFVSYDSVLAMGGYDGRQLTLDEANMGRPFGMERSVHPDMNGDIYQCPNDTVAGYEGRTSNSFFRTYGLNGHAAILSYKYGKLTVAEMDENMELGIVAWSKDHYSEGWGAILTNVPHPSETIMMSEKPSAGFLGNQYWGHIHDNSDTLESGMSTWTLNNTRYHNLGYNYLMIDGSYQNLLPEETADPTYPVDGPRSYGLWSLDSLKL